MLKCVLLVLFIFGTIEGSIVIKPSSCSFPFVYKSQKYDDCIKLDSKYYWCSTHSIYNGSFSYCDEDKSDQITDEHFYQLIKKSENVVERLNKLKESLNKTSSQCSQCIMALKSIAKTITDQTAIFMDQNKRLLGLREDHSKLSKVVEKIKRYYQLRRCKQSSTGIEYLGKISTTVSGFKCQAWSSQSPNKHKYKESDRFSDNNIDLARNYCRNPSKDKTPWCYVDSSSKSWEYCIIPECDKDCKTQESDPSSLPMCDSYPSFKCPIGSHFFNNHCYIQFKTPMNFADAERTCVKIGGHLASIHSNAENSFVAKTVFPGKEPFYIGLNDIKSEGKFEWTDSKPNDYVNFYSGEPNNAENEDCVQMGNFKAVRESWNDICCNARLGFVCKFQPQPIK